MYVTWENLWTKENLQRNVVVLGGQTVSTTDLSYLADLRGAIKDSDDIERRTRTGKECGHVNYYLLGAGGRNNE